MQKPYGCQHLNSWANVLQLQRTGCESRSSSASRWMHRCLSLSVIHHMRLAFGSS